MTNTLYKKRNPNIAVVTLVFVLCIIMLRYFVSWGVSVAFMGRGKKDDGQFGDSTHSVRFIRKKGKREKELMN